MKTLYVISSRYPYGRGDEYLTKELIESKKYFDKTIVFPQFADGEARQLPKGIDINLSLANTNLKLSKIFILSKLFLAFRIWLIEFFYSNKKKTLLLQFRNLLYAILKAIKLSQTFYAEINRTGENYYYAVSMDNGALLLSLLKSKGKLINSFFRLHGYDLYDERRIGNYMPFRYYNFKHANKVFVVSENGANYIKQKNIFPEKVQFNYSGLYDNGINYLTENNIFTLVSCSNIVELKRLDKIIEMLQSIDFPLKWVHFGDGSEKQKIEKLIKLLPVNISVELKGRISNDELITFYKSTPINLFIHLSDTEGLPMVIVEAQSFGIPALATNVGGVAEIVNNTTGILIDTKTSPPEIAKLITDFRISNKNNNQIRPLIKEQWKEKFEAVRNYQYFFGELTKNKYS